MADALVSPPVAGVAMLAAVALIAVAAKKVNKIERHDIVPLMGVLGAFVFAAQMINFTIPGTGSSGHIIGGILLTALVGPWAGFIILCSVLIIQCLIFADGGMLALGCNIINMAAMSCLVAAPLIYFPISKGGKSKIGIWIGSILASVVGLELGALFVTAETELSGITALSTINFLELMTSIHLAIGLCEGVATALVLSFVAAYQPSIMYQGIPNIESIPKGKLSKKTKRVLMAFGIMAVIFAVGFTWLASENPDGLEWSILRITGAAEIGAARVPATAFMPDYDSTFSGIVGGVIVMALLWGLCAILFRNKRNKDVKA